MRVRNGKIVEHWNCIDQLSFMQQLGVIPPSQDRRRTYEPRSVKDLTQSSAPRGERARDEGAGKSAGDDEDHCAVKSGAGSLMVSVISVLLRGRAPLSRLFVRGEIATTCTLGDVNTEAMVGA